MPKPNTIGETARQYSLIISQKDLDIVYKMSVKETREPNTHITMAAIIRKAVRKYIMENTNE